jgi:uncharacterized protein YbjT (DUF2867 family)
MRVAVVGGTGALGSVVVRELVARGDEVRVLSRSVPADLPAGVSHSRVDLTTGDGLADALADVETVVDAVNGTPRKAQAVLVEGGRRLTAAELAAGVGHHVAISIVGCDRVPLGYYKVKVAQEEAIAAGAVPWSLLRATQFHGFIAAILDAGRRLRVVPTGPARFQPVDAAVVARRLVDAVHDGPGGRLPDLAGPEVLTLTELSQAWRAHSPHRLLPVHLPAIGRTGRAYRDGKACEPSAAAPGPTFDEWLAARP